MWACDRFGHNTYQSRVSTSLLLRKATSSLLKTAFQLPSSSEKCNIATLSFNMSPISTPVEQLPVKITVYETTPKQSFDISSNREFEAQSEQHSKQSTFASKDEGSPTPVPTISSDESKSPEDSYPSRRRKLYHSILVLSTLITILATGALGVMLLRTANKSQELGEPVRAATYPCQVIFTILWVQWVIIMFYHAGEIGPCSKLGNCGEGFLLTGLAPMIPLLLVPFG